MRLHEISSIKDFRDPDRDPGAAEKMGKALSAYDARVQKSNELMPEVARALHGKVFIAKAKPLDRYASDRNEYLGINGIPVITTKGTVQIYLDYDQFNKGLAIFMKPGIIPHRHSSPNLAPKGSKARVAIQDDALEAGKRFYDVDFNSSDGEMIDWISYGLVDDVDKTVETIRAVINAVKKF